eukprot:2019333-Pyramimonas_sp.AAC.1
MSSPAEEYLSLTTHCAVLSTYRFRPTCAPSTPDDKRKAWPTGATFASSALNGLNVDARIA